MDYEIYLSELLIMLSTKSLEIKTTAKILVCDQNDSFTS